MFIYTYIHICIYIYIYIYIYIIAFRDPGVSGSDQLPDVQAISGAAADAFLLTKMNATCSEAGGLLSPFSL